MMEKLVTIVVSSDHASYDYKTFFYYFESCHFKYISSTAQSPLYVVHEKSFVTKLDGRKGKKGVVKN